jgi:hypothetical protein
MDKIYSRKRFLIPKLKGKESIFISESGWNNNKKQINKLENKKLVVFIIIVIIAVFVANKIIKTINPIMDSMCIDMAKSIETKI